MNRREFIALIATAAATRPLAAYAQQAAKVWRIGVLETTSPDLNKLNFEALRAGLRCAARPAAAISQTIARRSTCRTAGTSPATPT